VHRGSAEGVGERAAQHRATELKAVLGVGETVGKRRDAGECEVEQAFDPIRLAGKSGQQRFGMYRWHLTDPIRFESDLRITIQALGWRTEKTDRRYLPLQDDIASVAFWYQTLPTAPFPALPSPDYLRIV